MDNRVLAIRAVRISNDLYGSDVTCLFEPAKGYTMPLLPNVTPVPLSQDISRALDEIIAERKVAKVLRSNANASYAYSPCGIEQFYIKQDSEKRGKRSWGRSVLSTYNRAVIVTFPGSGPTGFVLRLNMYEQLLSKKTFR